MERQKHAFEKKAEFGEKERQRIVEKQEANAKMFVTKAGTLEEFKRLLIRKYGSIAMAWKYALDLSGDGKLSFSEFCHACRNNDYQGNLRDLWKILTGKDGSDEAEGVVRLRDLD